MNLLSNSSFGKPLTETQASSAALSKASVMAMVRSFVHPSNPFDL